MVFNPFPLFCAPARTDAVRVLHLIHRCAIPLPLKGKALVELPYKGKTTVTDENGTHSEVDAWILADMHSVLSEEELGGQEPTPKMIEVVTVIGYEGDNRIWNGEEYASKIVDDATTQGVGSCYVYYADTPEDRARSLQLLESFNVAFVDYFLNLFIT